MIWLKRIAPFVLLAALWFGYRAWTGWQQRRVEARQDRLARVMAEVWMGTARYRDDPTRFLSWRDSLLNAAGLDRQVYFDLLKAYHDQPEKSLPFVTKVRHYVDSLYVLEDSLRRRREAETVDSLSTDSVSDTAAVHSAGKASG